MTIAIYYLLVSAIVMTYIGVRGFWEELLFGPKNILDYNDDSYDFINNNPIVMGFLWPVTLVILLYRWVKKRLQ